MTGQTMSRIPGFDEVGPEFKPPIRLSFANVLTSLRKPRVQRPTIRLKLSSRRNLEIQRRACPWPVLAVRSNSRLESSLNRGEFWKDREPFHSRLPPNTALQPTVPPRAPRDLGNIWQSIWAIRVAAVAGPSAERSTVGRHSTHLQYFEAGKRQLALPISRCDNCFRFFVVKESH